jgi:hypothetical protein
MKSLSEDPRIPLVKIVLVGDSSEVPKECGKMIFAFINEPFKASDIDGLIGRVRK